MLLDSWVAGTPYYAAWDCRATLAVGQALELRREPANAFDPLAVEILTAAGAKLGYVPKASNPGIARRLDAETPLSCQLTALEITDDYLDIGFQILSLLPGDAPDDIEAVTINFPPGVTQPASAPVESFEVRFVRQALNEAQTALAYNERGRAWCKIENALNWAVDVCASRQNPPVTLRGSNVERFGQLMEEHASPLPRRLAALFLLWSDLYQEEGAAPPRVNGVIPMPQDEEGRLAAVHRLLWEWRERVAGAPGHPHTAERLQRLDWAFVSEVTATSAVIIGERAGILAGPAPADRWPVNRREAILRTVFRWLGIWDDARRGAIVPVTRLQSIRALNWDTALILSLQIEALQHSLELAPKNAKEEAQLAELNARYPNVYKAPLLPAAEHRAVLAEAMGLLQAEPPQPSVMLKLADRLRSLQPETRRRKRRRYRVVIQYDLYLAECFLRDAAQGQRDAYATIRLLTVCVPYHRLNRLRFHELERIANRLANRYFGVTATYLLNALPPPVMAERRGPAHGGFPWRGIETGIPPDVLPWRLLGGWFNFVVWAVAETTDWSDPATHEAYRNGLICRTLLREQIFLSSAKIGRRLRVTLESVDFFFLANTTASRHALGTEWEEAQGHLHSTHWWYYRRPPRQKPPANLQ